ncbi:hypothetical protein ABKN59_003584 [Abortiporus biennis]
MAPQAIQDKLQAEFCPPLDASLIAAIIADYDQPSKAEVQSIREILSSLAAQAENELSDQFSDLSFLDTQFNHAVSVSNDDTSSVCTSGMRRSSLSATPSRTASTTPTTISTVTSTNASSTNTSASDASSPTSMSSPLSFLQAAFPELPVHRLKSALMGMGMGDPVMDDDIDSSEIDMEAVVEYILSSEYLKELEERGMDELDEDQEPEPASWEIVERKGKKSKGKGVGLGVQNLPHPKKVKPASTTITFGDVRQQRRRSATTNQGSSSAFGSPRPPPQPDPWTQVSSLAIHLATLVPSHSASYFASMFHSPKYSSPATALRAALGNISAKVPASDSTDDEIALFVLFDILTSSDEDQLSASDKDQIMADAGLALRATEGRADSALDLVNLLRELDSDDVGSLSGSHGPVNWAVYHSPAPPPSLQSQANSPRSRLPTGPPPVPPPPQKIQRGTTNPSPFSNQSNVNAWQTVQPTLKKLPALHTHAAFIPSYDPGNVIGKKKKGKRKANGVESAPTSPTMMGGDGFGNVNLGMEIGGAIAGVDENLWSDDRQSHKKRATMLEMKRREMLKEAGRAWQRGIGGMKSHGGQVAAFYAEEARKLQEQAKVEKLVVIREMVQETRTFSNNVETIDLHGATVAEGISIVRELLNENPNGPTPSKPLKIITGRGLHSVNGVGVLAPSVKAALERDGWNVTTWQAGLVVKGRNLRRSV